MHVLIPFALSDDPACRAAAQGLTLPHLAEITRVFSLQVHAGLPTGLSMAHEHMLAQALELPLATTYPWAAWYASQHGLSTQDAWAYVTPCFWQVGQAQVVMANPQDLHVPAPESLSLLQAMQGFFKEDGLELMPDPGQRPGRWLARGEILRDLMAAPIERAVSTDVSPWLPQQPTLRRLQNEMQMLLYTHPVNDARLTRGAQPINSIWFSGAGAWPQDKPVISSDVLPVQSLQDAALNSDWSAWQAAWGALDASHLRELLKAAAHQPVQLTLCSEDKAITLSNSPLPFWQQLSRRLRPSPPVWKHL